MDNEVEVEEGEEEEEEVEGLAEEVDNVTEEIEEGLTDVTLFSPILSLSRFAFKDFILKRGKITRIKIV